MIMCGTVYAEVDEWWTEVGSSPIDPASDSPLIVTYPSGLTIDWQSKVAITTGSSAITGPMTIENRDKISGLAEENALKTMINAIGTLRVDGFTTLSDLFSNDPVLQDDVDSLIKKAHRIIHEKVLKEEAVLEVTIEMPLTGKAGLGGTVFPKLLPKLPSSSPTPPASPEISSQNYTGLVIDASGLGITGGLSPKIYSEDGTEIFALSRNKDKSILITSGMADYALVTSMGSELVQRAGDNPLNVTATKRMKSPYGCDIVISSFEAEKILKADKASNILKELKAVILL